MQSRSSNLPGNTKFGYWGAPAPLKMNFISLCDFLPTSDLAELSHRFKSHWGEQTFALWDVRLKNWLLQREIQVCYPWSRQNFQFNKTVKYGKILLPIFLVRSSPRLWAIIGEYMKGLLVDTFWPSRLLILWGRRLVGRFKSFTDLWSKNNFYGKLC